MHHRRIMLAGLGAAVGLVPALRAEDLEGAQKKILASWQKQTAITAKMTITSHIEPPGFGSLDTNATGTAEWRREGDKMLTRIDVNQTRVQKRDKQEFKEEQPLTIIADGALARVLTEAGGQKYAVKTKFDAENPFLLDTAVLLKDLTKDNDVKLLPDETINNVKTYAIEITPKTPEEGPVKTVYYVDQATGLTIKRTALDDKGTALLTLTLTDVKYDAKLDPERFVFKVPEGAKEIDQTKAPGEEGSAASGPAARPATQPATKPTAETPAQK